MLTPHKHNALRTPYPIAALKVGKLYRCTSHNLIAFSDMKSTTGNVGGPYKKQKTAETVASTWTDYLGFKVSCLPTNEPFMVIEKIGRLAKVMSSSAFGWVMLTELALKIEEVTK